MKILFDQNISYKIANKLKKLYPEARHVRHVGLEDKEDYEIWEYAKSNGFAIATFDSDYYDIALVKGSPPKIIWLRTGNLSTDEISALFQKDYELLKAFLTNKDFFEVSCIIMT
ncbi:MAG: hypothetical protein A2275_16105 [Bacteroidetes bacterium RIFOXYA12_FULL_35_11]|nr:MAG: hypothetical protein A2X01_05275 [Bacteroidetes bacterium GWF2_35_48]OFY75899.1 MAG: hypothetical protein A2275_16105 [Bacteroidetes bacterium RIFOXYA12_FULL_35_11]OFY92818.1 MAG: hypothetical protein A2491_07610 [Bacteroidetes bacterium RIFOXYC12_FULL_35_7]HBX52164.1 hypothetical protein [Bacteroidales bacterium]